MKNYSLYACAVLITALTSCRNENTTTKVPLSGDVKTRQRYDQIKEFAFLEGDWQNNTPDGLFTEKWKKDNDSTFTAHSVIKNGKDTLFHETIVLDQKGDSLHYIVTNPKQTTADRSVSFTLKSFTANKYVFENKQHDFPQRITYTKVTEDSLVAEISGTQNGKPAMEEFPMKRVK
jgi:hypothetical protein